MTPIEALAKCAEQFREYERLHLLKQPPDKDKAHRNAMMAEMCENVLTNNPVWQGLITATEILSKFDGGDTKQEEWEAAYAHCFKQLNEVISTNYRISNPSIEKAIDRLIAADGGVPMQRHVAEKYARAVIESIRSTT